MTHRRAIRSLLPVFLASASALLGCESSTAPKAILGTYKIVTPVCCWNAGFGNTPIAAEIVLGSSWFAMRQVVFRQSSGAQTTTTESGRFELSRDTVTIHVRTDFTSDFRYNAVLLGDTLRVSYPSPGDGPDDTELYVRRSPSAFGNFGWVLPASSGRVVDFRD